MGAVSSPDIIVGLTQERYTVYEDETRARVCVELMTNSSDCIIPFPFFIIFNTQTLPGGGTVNILHGFLHFTNFASLESFTIFNCRGRANPRWQSVIQKNLWQKLFVNNLNPQYISTTWYVKGFSLTTAESPADFDALVDITKRISFCTIQDCIDINMNDDELVEGVEEFKISISRSDDLDSRIHLSPITAVIAINDDDS